MNTTLDDTTMSSIHVPYGLRRVPLSVMATLLPVRENPTPGDIALAQLKTNDRTTQIELFNGRIATLHEGDLLAVSFGNRYATAQFEGYARCQGDCCDLLSIGGLCGTVESKHAAAAEPSKLRLLGAIGDTEGRPVRLQNHALLPVPATAQARVIVVCGSSMGAGKTHTAMSTICGLQQMCRQVAGIKLTGAAAGQDTWSLADAGASPALDFIDGGFPSTYLASLEELLRLYQLLTAHAASAGAEYVVVEIAAGLLEKESAALLKCAAFRETVAAWLFATSDPLAAIAGVRILMKWGVIPLAISGVIAMSPLAMREAQEATGIPCLTAKELQQGSLNEQMSEMRVPSHKGHSWRYPLDGLLTRAAAVFM
jgi:hypothetical protein